MPVGDETRTGPDGPEGPPAPDRSAWELRLREALVRAAREAQARRVCVRPRRPG